MKSRLRSLIAEAADLVMSIRANLPLVARKIPGVWAGLDRLEKIFKEMGKPDTNDDEDTNELN